MEIPDFGIKQLDTASPLIDLININRQSKLDTAQLATSGIDLQNKKNMLTMQTLSAGAAGGQASYDQAKQLLQKNNIDVSGWAPDYQTGQVQAKALQTALIPPAVMMNAGIAQQAANAKTAETNGERAPGNIGVGSPAAPQVQSSQGGPTVPQILAQPVQPTGPAGNSPPALPTQAPPQQGAMQDGTTLQEHLQKASPEDLKTGQNIVNGAAQLESIKNDPEAVTKFLNDGSNIHDQHNIDMRKLWMSDKQKFWQENTKDLQTGQAMGIAPQAAAPQQQGFVPSQAPANENPSAKEKRIASELAVYNANNKAIIEGATTEAKNAADYKKSLLDKVSEGEGAIRIINAQEKMLKNFTPGALTTDRAAMANFATTLGMPDSMIKSIAGGDPGAIEAFQGLSSQHALLQLKSLVDGGRINKTEYQGFKEDLANPNKLESAILAINQIQKDNYAAQTKELGAMTAWEQSGKPLSQFRQNYAQNVSKELMDTSRSNSPTAVQSGPPNGKQIGTSGGKAVYEIPDGKGGVTHVMEQ